MEEEYHEEWWVAGIVIVIILIFFAVHFFSSPTGPLDPPLATKVVSVTLIKDSSCADCIDMNKLIDEMRGKGITIGGITSSEVNESRNLIEKYSITKVPTLILSKEFSEYPEVRDSWENFGSVETDGSYVYRNVLPPYREVESGKVRGYVDITHIRDQACESCLDTNILKASLAAFGVKFAKENSLDVSNAT